MRSARPRALRHPGARLPPPRRGVNVHYILQNQNVPDTMNEQRGFLEDMGQLMVAWGIPRNTGRIYAYLLLQSAPAGLDRIAEDLEMGKSGASVATRQL